MSTPTTPREPLDLEALERQCDREEKLRLPCTVGFRLSTIRALLARIRELEAERRWRPISEAPKDGTPVWLATTAGIFAAHAAVRHTGSEPTRWLAPARFAALALVEGEPTHFQPLPAPPTTEAT
jgi:hypothetical protein